MMKRLTSPRLVALLCAVIGAAIVSSASAATVASTTHLHPLPLVTRAPLRPMLRPIMATPMPAESFIAGRPSALWHLVRHPSDAPLRNAPKLSQFLVKSGPHSWTVREQKLESPMLAGRHVRPYAANGNTIVLTGSANDFLFNDVTLPYGSDVWITCEGLPTNVNASFQYYVYPPDGSGAQVSNTISTDSNGVCSSYGHFNLSTPFGGFGSSAVNGSAYPGVWVVAIYDTKTGQFLTETAIVAEASINFTTYSNLGLTTPAVNFSAGSTIAFNATGLNAAHDYAFGFVYTSGSNIPCYGSIPSNAANNANGVCFKGNPTGLQAYGGSLTQFLSSTTTPSTSAAPTGTYDIELYDTTAGEMVGHQQVSVGNSATWTLTPYNSNGEPLPSGFNYNNTFASDGLIDQSVTGLTYAASGIAGTAGTGLDLTISDPNGVILNGGAYGSCYCGKAGAGYDLPSETPAIPVTLGAGGTVSKQVAFPLSTALNQAFGPTQTPFAPNVFSAQLYNPASASEVGSEAFQILGYYAKLAWSSGTILSAGATPTTGTVTITNTGGSNFGSWNGDTISGITLSTTATDGESLGLSSTTATDSAGNTWTIAASGSGTSTVLTATPSSRNVGIPVGGTLTFNVTVTIPSGDCTTPCDISTSILPQHGIAYSGVNTATNVLEVLSSGVSQNTVEPTLTWAVQSESSTANMAARVSAFDQLLYITGTANAPSTDYYTVNVTLNNVISAGGHNLSEVLFTFPVSANFTTTPPTIVSAPGGTGTWAVYTNIPASPYNPNPLGGYGANVFALGCSEGGADKCGIPQGSSGTFTLKIPLFATSFPETAIGASANFDKGNIAGNCYYPACNDPAYPLYASTVTHQTIDGNTTVYSNMLGAYSLIPTDMSLQFTPSSVGTTNASSTLLFTNTSTSVDPNPDYVDRLNLTFPTGSDPSSITPPSGWYAWETSAGSRSWVIATCPKPGPTNTTPCSNPEPSAIAPGGSLSLGVAWTTATAGSYNVSWTATGADGGETTSAQTTSITFTNTTASYGFTAINGASVANGTEPQVGTDTIVSGKPWTDNGSAYQMTFTNSGTTALDKIVITVPHLTRTGSAGSDTHTSNGGYYDITSVSQAYTGGASGCTSSFTNPSAGADGSITLSGCTIPAGSSVIVTFDAQTPYLIGYEFVFPATVYQGATAYTANPSYSSADVVSVVLNGTLTIVTPGNGSVNAGNPLAPIDNTLTTSTACTNCSVTTGTPNLVDFGGFTGTFTTGDIVDASVLSDANSTTGNSWTLYVSTATNPSNMLYTSVDNTSGHYSTGVTVSQSAYAVVPTSSPGLQLSTFSSVARHGPADSIMNYQVQTGGNTSSETVTLTYTLIFN